MNVGVVVTVAVAVGVRVDVGVAVRVALGVSVRVGVREPQLVLGGEARLDLHDGRQHAAALQRVAGEREPLRPLMRSSGRSPCCRNT